MDNQQRFQAFYGNNKRAGTCHGAGRMGDGYVCPTPSMGGSGSGIAKHSSACGTPASNMGTLAHCQVGGGSVEGMMFTATGQLNKKKSVCQRGGGHGHGHKKCKCNGQCGQNCKCGSKCKCKKGRYTPDSHSPLFNDNSDPSLPNHSGDSSVLDCPCDSCSSYCDYKNGRGTPINGYYIDVASAPIGNRPVHGTHDNMKINDPAAWNGNLMDRKFDCQQPFWCEKCL